MHRRLIPFRHRFAYRVFSLWLDLDELPALSQQLRWFSHNRFNLISFHDRDHGRRDGGPLKPWVEGLLAERGMTIHGGRVAMLCFPRVLGYAFNPLTIYFCWDGTGELRAVLYQVKNTFGEQHCYLPPLAPRQSSQALIIQSCDKRFHVSPFIGMAATYRFRLQEPDDRLSIMIRQATPAGELLQAVHSASRVRLDDAALLRVWVTHPLVTVKVIAGIHWEAFKLWLKGARYHSRPAPPKVEVSR